MSKVVTIPKDRNPFVVIVNGVKHSYPAGVTTEVPDEVADVIEKYVGAKPKPNPNAGSGVSWNDLKDKPFGEGLATGVVISRQWVGVDYEGREELGANGYFLEGKSYTVTFDKVTYECVAWYHEEWGALVIGNGSLIGADGLGDDVPFAIESYSEGVAYVNTSEGEHRVEVYGEFCEILPLEDKYIPTGYALIDDVYDIYNEFNGLVEFYFEKDGNYIYADENYEEVVSRDDLASAFFNQRLFLITYETERGDNIRYACPVLQFYDNSSDGYATAYILVRTSNGTEIRPYYTAEYTVVPV